MQFMNNQGYNTLIEGCRTHGKRTAITRTIRFLSVVLLLGLAFGCTSTAKATSSSPTAASSSLDDSPVEQFDAANLRVGAERFPQYLHLLDGKRVGLVVNQSARVRTDSLNNAGTNTLATSDEPDTHLLDALLAQKVDVKAVFSPEHGFRGNKGAGEKITSSVDAKTGLPIHSLYGKTKKPTPEMLENIDVLVFDIQDVGVRFYTYLSTLHYVIEAAFERNIDVVVLDRPNPNGQHVDGPILESAFSSFVGMHPIPVLHGMTLGELAKMMVGENWLTHSAATTSQLTVVPISHYKRVSHYRRTMHYSLPVAPSPNLPNDVAVALYPTLCFFEGTDVSVGRGTNLPFQLIGHPLIELGNNKITVKANAAAPYPKHEDQVLFSTVFETHDALTTVNTESGIDVQLLINTYQAFQQAKNDKSASVLFFTRPEFFDKLAGTNTLREMIKNGKSAEEIKQSWAADLQKFKAQRRPYLLYPDVENTK